MRSDFFPFLILFRCAEGRASGRGGRKGRKTEEKEEERDDSVWHSYVVVTFSDLTTH